MALDLEFLKPNGVGVGWAPLLSLIILDVPKGAILLGRNIVYQWRNFCLFDIVHSVFWGSEYLVFTPDAQVLFLSGAIMLCTQHSAVQALPCGI
jgi:hypothetical protein